MCEGSDYYMYIPPELHLYYVYATQQSEASKDSPLSSPLNNVVVPNALTNEDFDTLFAVLDDNNNNNNNEVNSTSKQLNEE